MQQLTAAVWLLIFGALSSTTLAADMHDVTRAIDTHYILSIDGPIVNGDYKKLLSIIKRRHALPYSVEISSPGGDVSDAMAMGRLFRKGLVGVDPYWK